MRLGLIRLLLALSVLIEHSSPVCGIALAGGELAVQAFYVISGFYMAMILQDRYAGRTARFYRNRFLRLFPMYWSILGLTLGLSAALWLASHGTRAGLLGAWLDNGSALGWGPRLLLGFSIPFLFLQDAVLFLGAAPDGVLLFATNFRALDVPLHPFLPIAPSWSLALELSFYLLCPWIARLRIRWILAIAALSFGLKLGMASRGLDFDPWSYRFFPTSLGYFLAGMLAWRIGSRNRLPALPAALRTALWLGLVGTLLLWRSGPEPRSLLFVAALACLLPSVFRLSKDWRWDRRIGDLSFPLYLSHWPTFAVVAHAPAPVRILAALAVAVALQLTVGRLVERRRQRAI